MCSPPEGWQTSPKSQLAGRDLAVPQAQGDSRSAPRWQHQRAFAAYHSGAAGAYRIPSPWSGSLEGLLKRKMLRISLSHSRSHTTPPSPYEGFIEGSCSEPLHGQWASISVRHLHPGATQAISSQDPAPLLPAIASPQAT